MPAKPMSLAQLAAPTGFLIADIAFLSGLEESTLSRLWEDPEWLDRVKGKTLKSIVSVVPGVGEYLAGFSLADRRSRLAEDLSRTDADIDEAEFRRLVQQRRVPEQYLGNALDAAVHILRRDVRPRPHAWPVSGVGIRTSRSAICSATRMRVVYSQIQTH